MCVSVSFERSILPGRASLGRPNVFCESAESSKLWAKIPIDAVVTCSDTSWHANEDSSLETGRSFLLAAYCHHHQTRLSLKPTPLAPLCLSKMELMRPLLLSLCQQPVVPQSQPFGIKYFGPCFICGYTCVECSRLSCFRNSKPLVAVPQNK
jgi:hypothetical protein